MRAGIHPDYVECTVTCSCGSSFVTRATVPEMHLELCSNCHPFYTGQQKFVDTGGRVGRFEGKFGDAGSKVLEREVEAREARVTAQAKIEEAARVEREERTKKRDERRVRAAERAELGEAKAGRAADAVASKEEAPAEEPAAEDTEEPVEASAEAEAEVEETPVDDTPAEDAPAEDAPAEDTKEEASE